MNKSVLLLCVALVSVSLLPAQNVSEIGNHLRNQRYGSAEVNAHALLKQDASNLQAWQLLTSAYLYQGDSSTVSDSINMAPAAIQSEPEYQVAKGAVLLRNNKVAEANALFQQAIDKTKGKNPGILSYIAEWHIELPAGDPQYAIGLLEKAIKRDKKNPDLYIQLGKAYRRLHKGGEAYQNFTEAIDRDKNAAVAYYELGRIFLTQKNPDMYLDYFQKAVNADPGFAPAYYSLYNHYVYSDPAKAMNYFRQYQAGADQDPQNEYSYTDLLYLNNQYDSAIINAKQLLARDADEAPARLYKLIAYSQAGKGDTTHALENMKSYFQKEIDSNFVVKDFETMALLYEANGGGEDSALVYWEKAANASTDVAVTSNYYQQMVRLAKQINQPALEAKWLGKYYMVNPDATNVTLFNWGLAAYKAEDFVQADTVFALYTQKYPEQGYGYYWRARSNAAIDTSLEMGIAIPHYQQLIDVIKLDSASSAEKKWLTEAYTYLASYKTNTEKDYEGAIDYFEKLLVVDPANDQAKKYIEMLERNIEANGSK